MRYLASEKLEIIRVVEQSHLPVRRALCFPAQPPAKLQACSTPDAAPQPVWEAASK